MRVQIRKTWLKLRFFLRGPAVLAAFFAVVAGPAWAAPIEVKDIRVALFGNDTRFVIDLSDRVEPRVFGLPDPFRVVIDLPEVVFTLPAERIHATAGLIERLRYGLFRPGTSRFVLDLRTPAKVTKQFMLKPDGAKPWRLVIDLRATSRTDFLVAMRPSPATVKPQPAPQPSFRTVPKKRSKHVVVLDPGHGGVDPGAIGVSGAYEKNIVLVYAHDIKRRLEATGRFKVLMTRDRDVFLPLRERVRFGQHAEADLFVSLHVNTHRRKATRGFSIYTLSEKASDKEAAALAAKENKSDVIGGVNLGNYSDEVQNILIDFAQSKTNELSVSFARDILLKEVSGKTRLLKRPWRSAGFAVLKAPDVPSVLIEMGYISNPYEERKLRGQEGRSILSGAITTAIIRYFDTLKRAGL